MSVPSAVQFKPVSMATSAFVNSNGNLPQSVKPNTQLAIQSTLPTKELSIRGQKAGESTTKFADGILANIQTSAAGETGTKLIEIVTIAKGLNISDIKGTKSNIPIIGPFINLFKKNKDKFVARFNSLKEQLDVVVAELKVSSVALEKRNEMLEELYVHNMKEYKDLELLIAESEILLEQERSSYQAMAKSLENDQDMLKSQQLSDWSADIEKFDKQLADIRSIQMIALQTMPEIRIIQQNNARLVEKFHNARDITIPIWKKQFVLAVSLDEQRQSAHLAEKIDNMTNETFKKNAELLKMNSISVAKTNQRQVIDIETLQEVQQTLISTVEELTVIEKEGQVKRAALKGQLGNLKEELRAKLTKK